MVSPEGRSVEAVVEGGAGGRRRSTGDSMAAAEGGWGIDSKRGISNLRWVGGKFAGADKICLPNEISGPSSKKCRPPGG